MRLDRFFLPRIIIRGVGLIGERIDEAATDKQYIEYKKARRRNDTQGYAARQEIMITRIIIIIKAGGEKIIIH